MEQRVSSEGTNVDHPLHCIVCLLEIAMGDDEECHLQQVLFPLERGGGGGEGEGRRRRGRGRGCVEKGGGGGGEGVWRRRGRGRGCVEKEGEVEGERVCVIFDCDVFVLGGWHQLNAYTH